VEFSGRKQTELATILRFGAIKIVHYTREASDNRFGIFLSDRKIPTFDPPSIVILSCA